MRDENRLVETADWSGTSHIIWHEYFGSKKIVQDLSIMPGWTEGRIKVILDSVQAVDWMC